VFRPHPCRVGVVSDVHAHPGDLARALDLLVDRGADRIVCLGDVLEKGPDPDGAVAMLQAWLVPTVAGNHDLNALRHLQEAPDSLLPETAEVVGRWPLVREATWSGQRVVMAHATPYDTRTAVLAGDIPRELKRRVRTLDVDVMLLGHAHRPFAAWWNGILLANPGSVRGVSARDSHTAALLHLPERVFEVFDLASGRGRIA
jgi:putative phosphoesterase